jgi:hypothetical protein
MRIALQQNAIRSFIQEDFEIGDIVIPSPICPRTGNTRHIFGTRAVRVNREKNFLPSAVNNKRIKPAFKRPDPVYTAGIIPGAQKGTKKTGPSRIPDEPYAFIGRNTGTGMCVIMNVPDIFIGQTGRPGGIRLLEPAASAALQTVIIGDKLFQRHIPRRL